MTKSKEVLNRDVVLLKKEFELTLCEPGVFVGMLIERDRNKKKVFVHQQNYIIKKLYEFNMMSCDVHKVILLWIKDVH